MSKRFKKSVRYSKLLEMMYIEADGIIYKRRIMVQQVPSRIKKA
ncbi:hypothetical protein [Sporosarcina thermotolerans]